VTLIEAVLFISIALGLIVGGLVFFSQAQKSARAAETIRLVSSLLTEIRAFKQSNLANTDMDQVLVAMGAVPSKYIIDPPDFQCHIKSPWDGCVKAFTGNRTGNPALESEEAIVLYLLDMPPEICTRLVHFDESGNGPLDHSINVVEKVNVEGSNSVTVARHVRRLHGAMTPSSPGECVNGPCAATFCGNFATHETEYLRVEVPRE